MNCQACGYELKDNDRVCNGCGMPVSGIRRIRLGCAGNDTMADPMFQGNDGNETMTLKHNVVQTAGTVGPDEDNSDESAAVDAACKIAVDEAERKKIEYQVIRQAAEKAAKKAYLLDAAAKDAIAKEKNVKQEALAAAEEAALKEAAAREATDQERAAQEVVDQTEDDFERAIKEAAQRTAAKVAYLEKNEAKKAIEKANTAQEAAEQASAESRERGAVARKALEEAARKAGAEAAARRMLDEAIAKMEAAQAVARQAVKRENVRKTWDTQPTEERTAFRKPESNDIRRLVGETSDVHLPNKIAAAHMTEEAAAAHVVEETAAVRRSEEAAVQQKADAAKPAAPLLPLHTSIVEGNFPSVLIMMDQGQSIFTHPDAMVWMSADISVQARPQPAGPPIMAVYTANAPGQEISLATRFPGEIQCLEMGAVSIIIQKEAFLAAQPTIRLSEHSTVHLGGEHAQHHFAFQRMSGAGTAIIAIRGSLVERTLGPGEVIRADVAHLAALEERVSFQMAVIAGFQDAVPEGGGRLLATLTGPGKVWLQTLPASG